MHTFEFIRPADQAGAIATAAQSKTAQQGADVRFLGGGTTLIDLMKLNVETPASLVDINRLPLQRRFSPYRRSISSSAASATK
jgi:xanthine dehydrogenase YagS FAD-binding subunit